MEKSKRVVSTRTMILLFAAVILCALGLAGAINVTMAQTEGWRESEIHHADIEQTHIGVALMEQTGAGKLQAVSTGEAAGSDGATGSLLADKATLLGADAQMVPGKPYDEMITVRNASSMDEYVRVTIYKNWSNADGTKLDNAQLSPDLIELGINKEDWLYSESESTPERAVYYLTSVLPQGADAPALVNSIALSSDVVTNKDALTKAAQNLGLVTTTVEGDVTTTSIAANINLAARVDSVQTNSVRAAAKSAWGVDIEALGLDWGKGA